LTNSVFDRLVLRLEAIGNLSDAERQAVRNLPITAREFRADQDIVREQDRPWQSCLLLEGFLQRYKMLPDGTRQIISFHVPGDIPDLESLHITTMDHSLATVTASRVALISHDAIRELTRAHPHIGDLFWRATLIDAAIFREWIVNVGSRDAHSRIAHLICELYLRLKAVGLTNGHSFEAPITQSEIGEATGLSTVHVNRSVQKLRLEGLITLEKARCTIKSWEGLKQAAGFDPTYLHQGIGGGSRDVTARGIAPETSPPPRPDGSGAGTNSR
jgi:CRP-like cAMP-binding protein